MFAENIPNLVHQIEMSVAHEQDQADESLFSSEDVREELERLRDHERPAVASNNTGRMCVPTQVPNLPTGGRITEEMKQLLSALQASENRRVGFCGMGGVGKTRSRRGSCGKRAPKAIQADCMDALWTRTKSCEASGADVHRADGVFDGADPAEKIVLLQKGNGRQEPVVSMICGKLSMSNSSTSLTLSGSGPSVLSCS